MGAATYDYAGLYEIPVGIEIDNGSGNIYVTGASASSSNNYDYATVKYDNTGTQLTVNRVSAPGTGFDKAAAIKRDNVGNLYITGSAFNQITNSYDIKTLKLNASLAVQWIKTYDDSGLEDAGISLDIDSSGNVYVGGYITTATTGKDFITLKYDANGNELWHQTYNNALVSEDEEINKIDVDDAGSVYVVGTLDKGNETDILTIKYDTNGDLKTISIYEQTIGGIDKPSDIKVDNSGNLYVTGKVFDGANSTNATIKYSIMDKDNSYEVDSSNSPIYVKNQIIVNFDSSALVLSTINNTDIVWGGINDFLKPSAIAQLQTKVPYSLLKCRVTKIFKKLTTDYTCSISRLGDTIPMPPFWASLLLTFPDNFFQYEELSISDSIETLYSIVKSSEVNYLFKYESTPKDASYALQVSLKDANNLADIKVEDAWDIETGTNTIKVGVFDSGIWWQHEDFLDPQNLSGSRIVDGYDFANSQNLLLEPDNIWDESGHGTKVAGIIGAARDNTLGVAGIAGGGVVGGAIVRRGVSLYACKLSKADGDYVADNIVMEALAEGSAQSPNSLAYGFGLHIINCSFSSYSDPDAILGSKYQLLHQVTHFANRNNVIFVAGRGNGGGNISAYPATINSKWTISVGGSNASGNYDTDICYGDSMDIIAPSASTLIYTTNTDIINNGVPNNNEYSDFNGSSASAPHVAGVAALLLSYKNNIIPYSYENLAPEDIESILRKSAIDKASVGYDEETGWGLLNANGALGMLSGGNDVLHFGLKVNDPFNTPNFSISQYQNSANIVLTDWAYEDQYLSAYQTPIAPGNYDAEVWKVEATINHNIGNKIILNAWARHSSSTVLPLYNSATGEINPTEVATLFNVTPNSAQMEGYCYRLKDVNGLVVGWIPVNPYNIDANNLQYSLYVGNLISVSDNVSIGEIKVYPNPSAQTNTLSFVTSNNVNMYVELLDMSGKQIEVLHKGMTNIGNNVLTNDISSLSQGIYLYKLTIGSTIQTIKFSKQ